MTTPFPPLMGVLIDELRISAGVRYAAEFSPPLPLGVADDTLFYWAFDEGTGETTLDAVSGMPMMLDAGVMRSPAD